MLLTLLLQSFYRQKGDSHWVLNPGCMVDVVTPLNPFALCPLVRKKTNNGALVRTGRRDDVTMRV